MTRVDRLYAEITARAARQAGETRPPATVPDRDVASPLAALHADHVDTGRVCDGIVRPGCTRTAIVEYAASGDPGSHGVYCGSCFALARFQTCGRSWHHVPLPPV